MSEHRKLATGLRYFHFRLGDNRLVEVVWTPEGLTVSCDGAVLPMEGDGHIPVSDRSAS